MTGVNSRPSIFAIKQIIGRSGSWQIRKTTSVSGVSYTVESMMDEKGMVIAVVDMIESVADLKAFHEKLEANLKEDESCGGDLALSEVRASMWQLVYAIEQALNLTNGI